METQAVSIPSVDWQAFKDWLCKDKRGFYVRDLVNYAWKYAGCLFKEDLTDVAVLSDGKRRMVLAALGNLAKFLGVYDQWRKTVQKFGVKWISVEAKDRRVIERITKKANPESVYGMVRNAKKAHPEYAFFLDFIALTGLRLIEAVESWILIKSIGNLNDYYDSEREILMHYKFTDKFMRKGKKTFISFVPKEFIDKIRNEPQIPIFSRHKLKVLNVCFSDLREAHASIMTKHLNRSEIDFLHGRVSTNIFMANYFNPMLIDDLKERVFKAIAEIQNKCFIHSARIIS
ncbi:MAG: integrase [Candidatus Bathyarchaeia archaeon]